MTVLVATGCLIAVVSGAGILLITYCETVDRLRRRRHAREDAARDHAIAVRRAEDEEVAWLYSIPTMKWDPERLGS